MSLLIPFANALQPALADRSHSGALHSTIPISLPVAAVSTAASPANALLLFGDSTTGIIAWSDETTDANSETANDLPVFNSNGDMYYIAFATGDKIESFDWFVSIAGVFTGTVTANITYRDASNNLVQLNNVAAPSFSTTGVKRLMLPSTIDFANLGEIDDPRNPRNARQRAVIIEFTGITGVTTSPLASRFWKRRTADAPKAISSFTSLIVNADKSPFNATTILPLSGDRSLLGFSAKTAALFANIVRIRHPAWQTTLIYSKADGTFGDYPTADINVTSGVINDELWTGGTGNFIDHLIPQSDWGKQSITDNVGTNNMYWLGWRYTADATQPELITQLTAYGGLLSGTGVTGAIAAEAATYTKLELFARTASNTETWLVLSNKRTEQTASVKLAANVSYALATISFTVVVGDEVVVQVLRGAQFFNSADGMIRLS